MIIARVTHYLVATAKTEHYRGYKILKLQPENWNGLPQASAPPIVALDLVDAGPGERVLVCQEGRWARETLGNDAAPVRSMVVAIVERVALAKSPPTLVK